MKKKNSQNTPNWALTGHRKPITRRELLGHGIIPFAGTLFAPQFLQLILSSNASAQSAACASAAGASMIPFVSLNLAGGAAMSSNFVPMNAAGSPIASYDKMGLGNNQVPIVREFGGGTFAGADANGNLISKMLQGLRETADADTMSKTAFVGVCVRSRDDSSENDANIAGLVSKLGLEGSKLPNVGSRPTPTGASQKAVLINPPSPLVVSNFRDISNSLGYSAALGTQLNADQKNKLARLVSNLSANQARKLASVKTGSQIQTLVECAGIKNSAVIAEGSTTVNPTQNAPFSGVWNINQGSNQGGQDFIFGSMIYNSLLGNAGSATLEMGGYDYHNNTRTTGDQRDLDAGRVMGRILQSAKVLNKPVFLYVTSDGGVNSPTSEARDAVWTSDRGSAGAAYIFMFNPAGRPAVSSNQIGHFTDGQVADDKFVTGNNTGLAGQAVFANYLKLNNKLDQFNKIIARGALDAAGLNAVVKVA